MRLAVKIAFGTSEFHSWAGKIDAVECALAMVSGHALVESESERFAFGIRQEKFKCLTFGCRVNLFEGKFRGLVVMPV